MTSPTNSELEPLDQNRAMRDNDRLVRRDLASVFSRGNLAVNSSPTFLVSAALDPAKTLFLFDTTFGPITATLPASNYWGVNKSPILLLKFVTGASTVTITPSGTDTIDGAATKVLSSGALLLYTDGLGSWYSFVSAGGGSLGIENVPTVLQDNNYTRVTPAGAATPFGPPDMIPAAQQFSISGAGTTSYQQAVLYNGSGYLEECLLWNIEAAGTGYTASCRITIDGVVVYANTNMLSLTMSYQLVVGSDIYQNNAGGGNSVRVVGQSSSPWGFTTSIKIEIAQSAIARTTWVGWKLFKQT